MKNRAQSERVANISGSYHRDVISQLDCLQEMIASKDPGNLTVIALAAENIIKTVQKLHRFNLDGIEHGLA